MSILSKSDLITNAQVIRDESKPRANTKTRIYGVFRDLVDSSVFINEIRQSTGTGTTSVMSQAAITGLFSNISTGNTIVKVSNGLTKTDGVIRFGGNLTGNTTITVNSGRELKYLLPSSNFVVSGTSSSDILFTSGEFTVNVGDGSDITGLFGVAPSEGNFAYTDVGNDAKSSIVVNPSFLQLSSGNEGETSRTLLSVDQNQFRIDLDGSSKRFIISNLPTGTTSLPTNSFYRDYNAGNVIKMVGTQPTKIILASTGQTTVLGKVNTGSTSTDVLVLNPVTKEIESKIITSGGSGLSPLTFAAYTATTLTTLNLKPTVDKNKVVLAAAILRPDGNTSAGGSITWSILGTADGHNSMFFTSVSSNTSSITLTYPTVARVIHLSVTTDETLATRGVFCGGSVGLSNAIINLSQHSGVHSGYLRGNTNTWTRVGDTTAFTFGTLNAGQIYFRPPKPNNSGTDAQNGTYWTGCMAAYVGDKNYRIRRILSGLGSDYFGYQLLNSTGGTVTTVDTNDIIDIMTNTPKVNTLNVGANNSFGFPGNILTTNSNLWVFGVFELA